MNNKQFRIAVERYFPGERVTAITWLYGLSTEAMPEEADSYPATLHLTVSLSDGKDVEIGWDWYKAGRENDVGSFYGDLIRAWGNDEALDHWFFPPEDMQEDDINAIMGLMETYGTAYAREEDKPAGDNTYFEVY